MASSRVSLAELALEGGRAQEAESAVRAAIEEFRSEKDAEQELRARMILARSLLAQSRFREAEAEINQANSLVAASEYKAVL